MNKSPDLTFQQGELRIDVRRTDTTAVITWSGVSDARNPGAFLNGVVQRLVEELEGHTVTVDFRRLTFMNSSTVPAIISLIKRLDAQRIRSLVIFSEGDWQRTHLRCMQAIARTLEHITVEGRAGLGDSLGRARASQAPKT